ncbi:MAG: ABC transporter ATP-binding protein [Acidimicrobiia bacterium]|nr:MAG: ABC transporter ATP-binding protein [Acidimicrobiia bacterium]
MNDAVPLLDVHDLRVSSDAGRKQRAITTGMNLTVEAGETVGIVGESGSGKSMTARAIVRLLPPGVFADGRVVFEGRDLLDLNERAMIGVRGSGISMMLQDPFTMLNPLLRCGAHIDESLSDRRRLSKSERRAEVMRRLAEVGIDGDAVAGRYPFQLSGGMRQRVALAAALARDPKLLIADEPTTALDVTTQAEILELLRSVQQDRGMGVLLITHDLRVAFSVCDRIHVLYAGGVVEMSPAPAMEREPLNPYTLGLLLSEPAADRRQPELVAIPGSVPEPDEVAGSCSFAPRCSWVAERCWEGKPALVEAEPGRLSACIRLDEIRPQMLELRRSAALHVEAAPAVNTVVDSLIAVNEVSKTFKDGGGEVEALRSVSVAFDRGESVGMVGESGSGKTTLGRCLVGLETPSSGSIEIGGIDASNYQRLGKLDRSRLRGTIQIVFQDPYSSLNPRHTVGRALREAVRVHHEGDTSAEEPTVGSLLEQVGLPASYARRKPASLSGGERQRVAIARALAVRPDFLVCDEPVSALDVSVQAQILNLFKELREALGIGYLFITHDLAVVRQVVDRAYVLYRGEVVEQGPVDALFDDPQHVYTRKLIASLP